MKSYTYQNELIGKKQLRQLLGWSFTNYDSMQACSLADELKYLGFRYATQAGISISIEDLRVPFVKELLIEKASQEIVVAEKLYLKGKLTEVERFQKIIDTWNLTSESLKDQIIYFFKNYDPLNSVYIMAFSGARGNLSQVRQLVGMRGLMSDPSGQIMNLPIKKNFREGLTITDYLMSGYGARKGIVDTALKTANSGYLTRRLIDVAHDIFIREKDCFSTEQSSFIVSLTSTDSESFLAEKLVGRILNKPILDVETNATIANSNTQITPKLLQTIIQKQIPKVYIRSPLTCTLYRSICQQCYGWDLASQNMVHIGEAIGILAGQSIGEPGTQLTMRTFHTGGIFTSEAREQIISPSNGVIQFHNKLQTTELRTNRGEDVLVTKNAGTLVLIPDQSEQTLVRINVPRNTIIFPKNNQYILRDTVIGELINTKKQVKTEMKPILADKAGEVIIPRLKQKVNVINNNKLLWILFGQLYNSPNSSFVNFYPDYKIRPYSYVFRTKLMNPLSGSVENLNDKKSLPQRILTVVSPKYAIPNSCLKLLNNTLESRNALLILDSVKYLVAVKRHSFKPLIQLRNKRYLGLGITNSFHTLTGGTLYYHYKNARQTKTLGYYPKFLIKKKPYKSPIVHKTVIWLGEEIHNIKPTPKTEILVEQGDFISAGFEFVSEHFSKTSGVIDIQQKTNTLITISIKSGMLYRGENLEYLTRKFYYPGEVISSNITIKAPSFCQYLPGEQLDQLLIRPIQIYEFPIINSTNWKDLSLPNFQSHTRYCYKSNQTIKGVKNCRLISKLLTMKNSPTFKKAIQMQLVNSLKENVLQFKFIHKFLLNDYVFPELKYKNLQSCLLVQKNQFVSNYTTLGYFEAVTTIPLDIVKIKVKQEKSKQILVISNNDCSIVPKSQLPTKTIGDFVLNTEITSQTGRVVLENKHFLTIQKGRPYFFPNCKSKKQSSPTNLQYKFLSKPTTFTTTRKVFLNYNEITETVSINPRENIIFYGNTVSRLFIKTNGNLSVMVTPLLFKQFTINESKSDLKFQYLLKPNEFKDYLNNDEFTHYLNKHVVDFKKALKRKQLLIKSSELVKSKFKDDKKVNYQLTFVEVIQEVVEVEKWYRDAPQKLKTLTEAVGLQRITEDIVAQDMNSFFCKNGEFIEIGKPIGLLSLEKEITGDIVQGLPKIEEVLEARKKNIRIKQIPISQKKGLLFQTPMLDLNFEFKNVGEPIKENDRINPHKLLKAYFNHYGSIKQPQTLKRLLDNYEGSHKSFAKVQAFILTSVQSVYESQGVSINNKHLEVIIKQMTTKVVVTDGHDTPLLATEVIDLYHMASLNKTVKRLGKRPAYYAPLLLGITKSALNNPSFISAASFQETTRVLTKAAIEGRKDWLRGLKENIIIGHLIGAGTGFPNYRNCFQKPLTKPTVVQTTIETIKNVEQTPRQVF